MSCAPQLHQRCLSGLDHQPICHALGQGIRLRSGCGLTNVPPMRARPRRPTALQSLREEKIRYGNGHGVVEVDVNDAGEAAENHADVALVDEVTGQFGLTQQPLLPTPEYRPLAAERGHGEAAALVIEGRLEDALGVDSSSLRKDSVVPSV